MLQKICDGLERTDNIKRSTYIWNAINSGLSAAFCPVVLMVMTRTNGVYDAGVFSIAYAVAALMIFVGQYGLRRYQSSDIHEKYSFPEYHGMRFITCGAMLVASAAYGCYGILFRDYGWDKFTIVLLVCVLKIVQAYADVLHGRMQQKGRLDAAAKASALRFFLELASYSVVLFITHDLLISTITCILVSLTVLMLTSVNLSRRYCDSLRPSIGWQAFRGLAVEGFPLFISLFLNMYISNAPKYAIDSYLTEEIQAYYNVLFMPAFAIQLIAYFIYNPILTTYAKMWLSEQMEDLRKMISLIRRQGVLLLGLTLLAVAVALTIGIPLLSLIFGVDLDGYRRELAILMVGGGMMAGGFFFSTVLTIIREQKYLLISYGIVFAASKILAGFFVSHYGITGAVILYTVMMSALAILLLIFMVWKIHAEVKRRQVR